MNLDPAYAAYVWTAYGLSAGVLVLLTADTLLHARRWRREAENRREDRP